MDTSRLEYALRQHAYVMSQCVCAQAEIEAMKADNLRASDLGNSIPYGDADFIAILDRYSINHDSVIEAFTY